MTTIGLQGVTFGYAKTAVLVDETMEINLGQFVAMTGDNGAAKTTAMKLLVGRFKPWSGKRLWPKGIKASYVPQEMSAIEIDFPSTVQEFVLSGAWDAKKWYERVTKEDRMRAQHFIELFELGELLKQPIGQLSGGQKQKACVARAFMSEPDVLLLDEATVGMDEKARERFYEVLKSMCPKTTIILITHHVDELEKYVDQTIHLERRHDVCSI